MAVVEVGVGYQLTGPGRQFVKGHHTHTHTVWGGECGSETEGLANAGKCTAFYISSRNGWMEVAAVDCKRRLARIDHTLRV